MAKIYISSTYMDLQEQREAVYQSLRKLRHDVIAMEDYVASDQRPLDKCLADVEDSDIYVGIFAWRYGYVPEQDNPQSKSITELEYRRAVETGKPRLIFLLDKEAAWPPPLMDHTSAADGGQRITAFRQELEKNELVSYFKTTDQLTSLGSIAVQQQTERALSASSLDLDTVQTRFLEHMRRFAGASSDEDALRRYLPLRVQSTRLESAGQGGQFTAGAWHELVQYPAYGVLRGEPGSGKTTLLLYEAHRLAGEARLDLNTPLPVYLSLGAYNGGGAGELLEMAAAANHMARNTLLALWRTHRRAVCLLLDGADEAPARYASDLVEAISGLCRMNAAGRHSLVIACRPGPFSEQLSRLPVNFSEFILLSLSDKEIFRFLAAYDAAVLSSMLDARLREAVQNPDLLSALTQSVRHLPPHEVPRNAGQIYQRLIEGYLVAGQPCKYDYNRIQRPILARLAYTMLVREQDYLPCDDELYEEISKELAGMESRYHRRRTFMPYDWSAQGLLEELVDSQLLDLRREDGEQVFFSKRGYRDYFAAVHLALLGIKSAEVQRLIPKLDPRQWIQPVIILLGIQPEAGELFDALNAPDPQLATQLWFENRSPGVSVPSLITHTYENGAARLEASYLAGLHEPVTASLLRQLLDVADPRQRLQAARALTQWGPAATPALLDAAQDDHPLVQAVAQYALLHTGEPVFKGDLYRPIPPLLGVDGEQFSFHSYGAGVARIGPLTLLQVPIPSAISLAVHIGRLDFDPFEVESKFAFLPALPELLAAFLFEVKNGADWLDLAVRCHWIAAQSAATARQAEARTNLKGLQLQLQRRSASFASLGELLAHDLGIPWEPVELAPPPEKVLTRARQSYNLLRRLYSRTNQPVALQLAVQENDTDIKITQTFQKVLGAVTSIQVNDLQLPEGSETTDPVAKFSRVDFELQADELEGGQLSGMLVNRLCCTSQPLPLRLHVNGKLQVRSANSGSEVRALEVDLHAGRTSAWLASLDIAIQEFKDSQLYGVVIHSMGQA